MLINCSNRLVIMSHYTIWSNKLYILDIEADQFYDIRNEDVLNRKPIVVLVSLANKYYSV